ncbi:hypothetical protein BH24BAC1_BH24BAC1_33350 [soil metagenome]
MTAGGKGRSLYWPFLLAALTAFSYPHKPAKRSVIQEESCWREPAPVEKGRYFIGNSQRRCGSPARFLLNDGKKVGGKVIQTILLLLLLLLLLFLHLLLFQLLLLLLLSLQKLLSRPIRSSFKQGHQHPVLVRDADVVYAYFVFQAFFFGLYG